MSRRLVYWEFKKILEQPMIIIFLLLCLVFNMILILSTSFEKKYTEYVEEIRVTEGNYITEELKANLAQLPVTSNNQRLINELSETENIYLNYEMPELATDVIRNFHVEGDLEKKLANKYDKLQPVVQELAETNAGLDLAAAGETMSYFTFVRYHLIRILLAECVIFSLLIGLFSSTSEQLTKTMGTIFTSKVGRNSQKSKYFAGLIITSLFFLLVTICSTMLFSTYSNLGNIWQSSVATQFHLNVYIPVSLEIPFMTWIPMTLISYLLYSCLLIAVLTLLCFTCQFLIGLWLGSLIKGFVLVVGIFSGHLALANWTLKVGLWLIFEALMWSPFQLWMTQPHWFTEMAVYETIPFQECLILVIFFILLIFGTVLTRIYYPKKEVL